MLRIFQIETFSGIWFYEHLTPFTEVLLNAVFVFRCPFEEFHFLGTAESFRHALLSLANLKRHSIQSIMERLHR